VSSIVSSLLVGLGIGALFYIFRQDSRSYKTAVHHIISPSPPPSPHHHFHRHGSGQFIQRESTGKTRRFHSYTKPFIRGDPRTKHLESPDLLARFKSGPGLPEGMIDYGSI
jgi:hypothetical protein